MGNKSKLVQWVEQIRDQDMPSFGKIIQDILKVTNDGDSSASELAQVLLQDVAMTTKILKLSNSAMFNPLQLHISTVSRSVVTLGFDTIKDISLSVAMVDALVQGKNRDQLMKSLAQSIHAATQAREIAKLMGDSYPEETFIKALVHRIGEMAFWSFSGDIGEQILQLSKQPGYTPEKAQVELLGFKLDRLGAHLREEWNLVPSENDPSSPQRAKTVDLTHQFVSKLSAEGWEGATTAEAIKALATHCDKPVSDLKKTLHHSAQDAVEVARYLGAVKAAKLIPKPPAEKSDKKEGEPKQRPEVEEKTVSKYPQPDGSLQLKILRELAQQIEERPDLNIVMELTLEGIFRGVGMDRCLFALLTPDRKGIKAKTALGQGNLDFKDQFQFYREPHSKNIFFLTIERETASWIDPEKRPELKSYLPYEVTAAIGNKSFLTGPVAINGRALGLIYADRSLSGREIDQEAYESFSFFLKQANTGITLSATQRQK